MNQNWNFLGGGGCKTKKTFDGGSMNIFWNCTFHLFAKLCTSLVLTCDPVELKISNLTHILSWRILEVLNVNAIRLPSNNTVVNDYKTRNQNLEWENSL